MATDQEIERAARAMMRDLCKTRGYSHGCLLGFIPKYPENVVVRGHINLTALARAALKAVERTRARHAARKARIASC